MKKKLPDFTGKNIVIIGDLMLDQYIYGYVDRISPEAPVPVMLRGKTVLKAGGAANVALNVKAMGANPILIGSIGNDRSGDGLINVLETEGIDTSFILRSNSELTTVKTRLIAGSQHLMRIDEEIDAPVDDLITGELLNLLTDLADHKKIDAILVEDYDKGLMGPSLIDHIGILTEERNIFKAVDPKFRNFLDYKNYNLIKPNLREVNQALKNNYDSNLQDLHNASQLLVDALAPENVIITLGDEGIYGNNSTESLFLGAEQLDIVDVCGAGDAVFVVSALCLLVGLSLEDTLYWSNRAGAEVCKHPGVVAVEKSLLEK